jgi:hypothetical protein
MGRSNEPIPDSHYRPPSANMWHQRLKEEERRAREEE